MVLVLALLLWSWSWSLEFGLVYIIGDGQYQRIYPTGRYREKKYRGSRIAYRGVDDECRP